MTGPADRPVAWDSTTGRWRCRMCAAIGLHAQATDDGMGWRITCAGPDAHEWSPELGLRVLLGSPRGDDPSPVMVYGGPGVRCVLRLPGLPPDSALEGFDGRAVMMSAAPREGEAITFPTGTPLTVRHVVHYPFPAARDDDDGGGSGEAPFLYVVLAPPPRRDPP